jgi:hypothetical protein
MVWRGEAHHQGEVEVARKSRRGQMLANKRAAAGSAGEPAAARFHSWTTGAVVDVGTRCELRARAAPAVVAAQFADGVEAVVHWQGKGRTRRKRYTRGRRPHYLQLCTFQRETTLYEKINIIYDYLMMKLAF